MDLIKGKREVKVEVTRGSIPLRGKEASLSGSG